MSVKDLKMIGLKLKTININLPTIFINPLHLKSIYMTLAELRKEDQEDEEKEEKENPKNNKWSV